MINRLFQSYLAKKAIKKRNKNFQSGFFSLIDSDSTIGDFVKLNGKTVINKSNVGSFCYFVNAKISRTNMGNFCSIGPNALVGGLGKHPTNMLSTHPVFYSSLKQCGYSFTLNSHFEEFAVTSIGNDVWIGANSIVLDGVNVGDGAIIAAGSVVVKDVPPYAVVGGVPAKVIRYRFSKDEIDKLLNLNWWNLSKEELIERQVYFIKNDVKGLIASLE